MLEEARNSAGVMIGHSALVADHLENGSLVAPFTHTVDLDFRLAIATRRSAISEQILSEIIDSLLH